VPDQARVRDRSTILSRQLFSDAGDAAADRHAVQLMHSLGINPAVLPGQLDRSAWGQVWQEHAAHRAVPQHLAAHPVPGDSWAAEFATGRAAPAAAGPLADDWTREFHHALSQTAALPPPLAGPQHYHHQPMAAAWAQEFAPQPAAAVWAEEYSGVHSSEGAQWAQEFAAQAADATPAASGADAAVEQSRRLLGVLSNETDPKFQQSQFVKFLSKMSRGEVNFQSGANGAAAWADDFAGQQQQNSAAPAAWASDFSLQQQQQEGGPANWGDDFLSGQGQLQRSGGPAIAGAGDASTDAWASEYYNQQVCPCRMPLAVLSH
jgi:hypothetical protein